MEEIQREIAVLAQASHCPQLTQYHGSYVVGRTLWIAMEYLEGGSLGDLMALFCPQGRGVGEPAAAHALRALCRALVYLHGERKIHRDVKAKNILVSSSGRVKLADFGAAAQLTETKGKRNTFAGTPFWMAPEVITQSSYDAKADIWSVGITAIELAKGQPPYAATHPVRALFLIPKNPPPRLEEDDGGGEGDEGEVEGQQQRLRSGAGGAGDGGSRQRQVFSAEFKDFVARCLVTDPGARPTAADLLTLPFLLPTDPSVFEEGRAALVALVEKRRAQQQQQLERQQAEAAAAAAAAAAAVHAYDFHEFDHPPAHHADEDAAAAAAGEGEGGGGGGLRLTRRRIAALDLEECEQDHNGEGQGKHDPDSAYASTPTRGGPMTAMRAYSSHSPSLLSPCHAAGGGGWTPRRRRPPQSPAALPAPPPTGVARQLSSLSSGECSGGGGSGNNSDSGEEATPRGGHHHHHRRRPGPGLHHHHHRRDLSRGSSGTCADDLSAPALPGAPPLRHRQFSPHPHPHHGMLLPSIVMTRQLSPHIPITRQLSSTCSDGSAVTLPAGRGGGDGGGGGSGASSPFWPLEDEEGAGGHGGADDDDDDDGGGGPRWDFSLQGQKDLDALLTSASHAPPTGAGAEEDG